jgi:hypothetical protein
MALPGLREDDVLPNVAFKFKISGRKILFVDSVSGKVFSVESLVADRNERE